MRTRSTLVPPPLLGRKGSTSLKNWYGGKKILVTIRTFTLFFMVSTSILLSFRAKAQNPPACAQNCSAKDIKVKSIELVRINPNYDPTDANSQQYISLPPTCNQGDVITGYLRVNLDVTAATRYTFVIAGELYVDNVHITASDPFQCFPNTLDKGLRSLIITTDPIQWDCGSKLELKNVFTAWGNSSTDNVCTQTCDQISSHCKRYGLTETFTVVTSLKADFTWGAQCTGANTIETISFDASTTTGGTTPYKSYQWDFDNDGTFDATTTTPTTSHTYLATGDSTVRLRVTDQNDVTNDFFDDVTIAACCTKPVITTQPQDATACAGTATSFTVAYTDGTPAAGIQWQIKNGATWDNLSNTGVYSNTTTATLNISDATGLNGKQYRAVLTSGTCDAVNSSAATLTVNVKPVITTQPQDATACAGTATSFTVAYTDGTPAAGIQWQIKNGATWDNLSNTGVYSNTTTATLNISDATGLNGKQYRAVLTSGTCDAVNSSAATLTVNVKPVITTQPQDATACAGTATSFTVAYTDGTPAAGIQWQIKNGATWDNLSNTGVYSNTTTATLNISDATGLNGKQYRAVLTSGTCDAVNSSAATLTVNVKPVITTQPQDATACAGTATSFTVAYTDGTPAAGIQWQIKNGATWDNLSNTGVYSNTTTATLNISDATGLNGKQYRAVLTSGTCDAVNSSAATLTVNVKPVITTQPQDATACAGTATSFTVAYTDGTPAAGIQWQIKNGATWDNLSNTGVYSNTTTATLNISDATGLNGKQYRAVLTSGTCDAVNSSAATLTVNVKPVITTQPVSVTKCAGSSASFTVAATGTPTPTYQWQYRTSSAGSWTNVPTAIGDVYSGETTDNLSISDVTGLNGYEFRAIATNTCNTATSYGAVLTVNTLPAITGNPSDVMVCVRASASFSVTATGTGLTYQWYKGTPGSGSLVNNASNHIIGATSASLTINPVAVGDAGNYYVVVGGTCSPSVTSTAAKLRVKELNVVPSSQQYSDLVTFTGTIYNGVGLSAADYKSVTFKIGTQVMGSADFVTGSTDLVATLANQPLLETVAGIMTPSATSKKVSTIIKNSGGQAITENFCDTTLTITKEDACGEFTGSILFINTTDKGVLPNGTKIPLTLIVTQADDGNLGSLSAGTLNVTFNITADAGGYSKDLAASLVSVSPDGKSAVYSVDWTGPFDKINPLSATDPTRIFEVKWTIDGYYTNATCLDMTEITISYPASDFTTGGGFITNEFSLGDLKRDNGPIKKNNFGFNLKWNKNLTNLQGSFNTIIRKGSNLYQAKSNKPLYIKSEVIGSYTQGGKTYNKYRSTIIYGNVVLKALGNSDCATIPNCSVGNNTISLIIEDNGEPGGGVDRIGFTVRDGVGKVYYASNAYNNISNDAMRWFTTTHNLLVAGNIQVHVGNSGAITTRDVQSQTTLAQVFEFKATPNPTHSYFTVQLPNANNSAVNLRVVDVLGRVVEAKQNLAAGQTLRIGSSYKPGVYIVEVTQGGTVQQIKLIKQ